MPSNNTTKLELHILQNFPPHNLNRDDTGAPKDTEFGGYRRARVSSQCLKRSIRWSQGFRDELEGRIALRTQESASEVARLLVERHGHDEVPSTVIARATISALVGQIDENGNTSVMFYVGSDELEVLASGLHDAWETLAPLAVQPEADRNGEASAAKKSKAKGKKTAPAATALTDAVQPVIKTYLRDYNRLASTVDVALFGRMLAVKDEKTTAALNIDAACHVAHAIGTNRVSMDFDYFTAVDDLNTRDKTGAAMIGTTMFNSSCFYRYAVVDMGLLHNNLGGNATPTARELALTGARAFIKGAIAAIPSGKQSSMAAYTQPAFVMVVVRPNGSQPVSLANAFEQPIRPRGDDGLVAASVEALDNHWAELTTMYGTGGAHPFAAVVGSADRLVSLAPHRFASVEEVVNKAMAEIESMWTLGGAA